MWFWVVWAFEVNPTALRSFRASEVSVWLVDRYTFATSDSVLEGFLGFEVGCGIHIIVLVMSVVFFLC